MADIKSIGDTLVNLTVKDSLTTSKTPTALSPLLQLLLLLLDLLPVVTLRQRRKLRLT